MYKRQRAQGIDARPVAPPGPVVSVSSEETFETDIDDRDALRSITLRLAADVAERLDREGRVAQTVTVKVRYPDFRIATRAQRASAPFRDPDELARLAVAALERALAHRSPPLRLLGVGVTRLVDDEQLRLPVD